MNINLENLHVINDVCLNYLSVAVKRHHGQVKYRVERVYWAYSSRGLELLTAVARSLAAGRKV